MSSVTQRARARVGPTLPLISVLLVGLNLRGPIAAVSPVLPQLRADLSLSAPVAGLLTTLPVLCFALAAPAAARVGRRTGPERGVLLACVVIAGGCLVRVAHGIGLLFAGTLVVGLGMTVGNVLVPVVLKRDFGSRARTVTGVYTASLTGGAALAAAVTGPIAAVWGWRVALGAAAVLSVAGAGLWHRALGRAAEGSAEDRKAGEKPGLSVWTSTTAWAVALYLGLQSVLYYSVTAWLPTMLVDELGMSTAHAGVGMSVFQILGIPGTLLVPLLLRWARQQVLLGCAVALGWVVLLGGLLLWPELWPVWTTIGGVAQGAGISFAFTVMVLRAHDSRAAAALSSMAQLIGYSLGAAGPFVVGALFQWTSGWSVALLLLLCVAGALVACAMLAGRSTTVGAPSDGAVQTVP